MSALTSANVSSAIGRKSAMTALLGRRPKTPKIKVVKLPKNKRK